MNGEEFNRGEAKAKLENIESNVKEMKSDIKTIDLKLNDVDKSSQEAASKAGEVERAQIERNNENKENLASIKATVEKLAEAQASTKLKMYFIAGLLGGGSGIGISIIRDMLM